MRKLYQRLLRKERERCDPKSPPPEVRAAIERMEARLEIRRIDAGRVIARWKDVDLEQLLTNEDYVFDPPIVSDLPLPPGEEESYARALATVGEETSSATARDYDIIRQWEVRCYGRPGLLTSRSQVWGVWPRLDRYWESVRAKLDDPDGPSSPD